jgi:sulfur carrier protein
MRVVVNGDPRELPEQCTVADVVVASGAAAEGRGVAVAIDGEVVPRGRWDDIALADGARVEVVQAVQGG